MVRVANPGRSTLLQAQCALFLSCKAQWFPPICIHFLIHEFFESPAAFETWARERGHALSFTRLYAGDRLPADANGLDCESKSRAWPFIILFFRWKAGGLWMNRIRRFGFPL